MVSQNRVVNVLLTFCMCLHHSSHLFSTPDTSKIQEKFKIQKLFAFCIFFWKKPETHIFGFFQKSQAFWQHWKAVSHTTIHLSTIHACYLFSWASEIWFFGEERYWKTSFWIYYFFFHLPLSSDLNEGVTGSWIVVLVVIVGVGCLEFCRNIS